MKRKVSGGSPPQADPPVAECQESGVRCQESAFRECGGRHRAAARFCRQCVTSMIGWTVSHYQISVYDDCDLLLYGAPALDCDSIHNIYLPGNPMGSISI